MQVLSLEVINQALQGAAERPRRRPSLIPNQADGFNQAAVSYRCLNRQSAARYACLCLGRHLQIPPKKNLSNERQHFFGS